jgi:hypothetical protein
VLSRKRQEKKSQLARLVTVLQASLQQTVPDVGSLIFVQGKKG